MSAAIDQIGATIERAYARLKVIHWTRKKRNADMECEVAMTCGDRTAAAAHQTWADLCAMRLQTWTERVGEMSGGTYGDQMKEAALPAGKTCVDCQFMSRCSWLIHQRPDSTTCDWAPSKFLQRREPATEKTP